MKQTFKYALLLLLTLSSAHLYARLQGQALIDSMLKQLPCQKEDTNKVNMLVLLTYTYSNVDPDEGIKYGQLAQTLATKLEWKKGIGDANNRMGMNYLNKSEYSKALEHYSNALKIYEETGSKNGIAAVECNIGNVYQEKGDYAKSLECYLKALKLDEETGNTQYAATVTGNIGNSYGIQGDWPKAMEYYLKALAMYEDLKDKSGIARTTGNIGNAYISLQDTRKALEYFFKALKLNEELGNKMGIAVATINIGTAYQKVGNFAMSIEYYEHALKVSEEINAKDRISICLRSIGQLYLNIIGDTSMNQVKQKVSGMDELPASKYKLNKSIPTGKVALLRGAIEYLKRGLAIAKEINEPYEIRECYNSLESAYSLSRDYKSALEASNNWHAIKDSLFSKENNEKIVKMEMNDEYARQRFQDSIKTAEREKISTINLQKQKTYTYMGIAGILLLAGFSFFIVKERGKSEKERKKSDGLLLNILPIEVAEELKTTGTTTAKHYNNVSVLFTDFVNFTQASERMNPQVLIDELHNCFKAFDEITAKYAIEKIKTIGDAYLAVCGLPTADPKHAENAVSAAIEINAFMQDRLAKLGNSTFEIRIGIHSGSVVAGIVGVKKFAYDIWGDTVNTAARMEQNSEAGRINISQTTYELVKDKFSYEYRGEIDAKGKGMLKMYYVA